MKAALDALIISTLDIGNASKRDGREEHWRNLPFDLDTILTRHMTDDCIGLLCFVGVLFVY